MAVPSVRPRSEQALPPTLRTTCAIAGCGPAGAMLGLLLARAGIDVVVLEKHADFLRDFRGDTIHPSTLRILGELGLAARFLEIPHSEVREMRVRTPGGLVALANFSRLRTRYPFIAFVPQWDFLDFIVREASREPSFRLVREAEAVDLIADWSASDARVRGVRVRTVDGEHEILADLTVAADGRGSRLREAAGLVPIRQSPPMDVLWFRVSKRAGDPAGSGLMLGDGHVVVMLDRGNYWQVAYTIPKGGYNQIRSDGLPALRASIAHEAPPLTDRVDELTGWDRIFLLRVEANRLPRWWRPGFLAIGDAAHAMSPIGGVGINLAVQDAVVAANRLALPLIERRVEPADLAAIQRSREWPTRIIQAFQAVLQGRAFRRSRGTFPGWFSTLMQLPILGAVPAQLIGMGAWPVHVRPVRPPARTARRGRRAPPEVAAPVHHDPGRSARR